MYKVYVDGSYKDGRVAWGLLIIKADEIYASFSGVFSNEEGENSRQVAGELKAVEEAVFWAKENKVAVLDIYYDYDGIKYWVTGEWKAKKNLTKKYKDFILNSKVKLNFYKVKSHSGDKYNDMADKLAKNML